MIIISRDDLIGEIYNYPVHIVRAMCIEQVRQGNKFDVTVFQNQDLADCSMGGFDWGKSVLGKDVWFDVVYNNNFDRIKPTQHPHADSILLFAQQALDSKTPWAFWEFSLDSGKTWKPCLVCPQWNETALYRQKQQTMKIGDMVVRRSIDFKPKNGTTIFVATVASSLLYHKTQWTGSESNNELLKRGLVHLTQDGAIEHSKALILLSGGNA